MSTNDVQQRVPWYAEGVLDGSEESDRICAVMRELAAEWRDETPRFAAFARWVRGEALDQELFGETIGAWPEVLGVAWFAWMAAGESRWYGTASAEPSGAAGGVTVFPTAPPSAAAPPAAPAGVAPSAPAGVGPIDGAEVA